MGLPLIILFLLIPILFSKCQQTEYKTSEVIFKNDSAFTSTGRVLTGTVVTYYISGEKELVENYFNGKKEGKSTLYYKNGNPWEEISYHGGKQHGLHISYFENGARGRIKAYKNGIPHGIEVHYYLTGEIWREMDFENGELVFDKWHDRIFINKYPSTSDSINNAIKRPINRS